MHFVLYALGLFLGIVTARAATLMARVGVEPTTLGPSIVSGLAVVATFGLVALGFVLYAWWVPVVSFVGISLVIAFVVTRRTLGFFHLAQPVTGLATIAICAYGWYAWATD